ncbi:MAG: class I SAM-dependent methyltransferase [Actinomycetota bacterium]|nr:class I SAM-dependent methyltransferase [Actinomycetota bacterium]
MITCTVEDALRAADGVDGWMTPDQGRRLYAAATRCRPGGRIVEIGSFRGRSTIVLASAAAPDVEVVAVDPHAGNDRGPQELDGYAEAARTDREVFEANLAAAGVAARVRHVAALSADAHGAIDGLVDVLYIDGAHRFTPARDDIRAWGDRVTDGGTMLIHDSFSSVGVTLAIGRELVAGRRFRYVGRSRSLAEYRADLPDDGLSARLDNAARQLAQLPWFVKNLALKAVLTLGLGRLARRVGWRVPEWPY